MKVRTDAKRDEIVEIARKTFLELGYERASMAEISARMGGSKATLYGYFPSKEALFLAIVNRLAEQYVSPAVQRLEESVDDDVREALQRFGEQFLAFISDPEAVASYRVVISEAAHSDIGESFYETGPKRTIESIARYLAGAMDRKQLRRADPEIAAQHLTALLAHGEPWHQYFLRKAPNPTRAQIKRIVERALDVFLGGYRA
ncbi:TetR family transcriptional regulator [Steroidobacter agaridevorans]|uniref:TetR family transcriptional regulator n=1 Tax=Steroidobacter agaridevorans TaxID=2695856 RepID=A0A829YN02_9GAMM|nr:TetR/AcrR family transcriptional regulator [Steroidobacter agaridevorans]GFE83876.1 TetR family transcriptional regulator [Steroidobacter agaridevorans]GFE91537.1 TetR family transcriptional regulator [Steroidobacter agaridevorans]